MNRLGHYLQNIEDYRHPKGKRHQLLSSLIIMIMAMTCGYTGFRAMARFAKIQSRLRQVSQQRGYKLPILCTPYELLPEN